jgi:hypothetical protein
MKHILCFLCFEAIFLYGLHAQEIQITNIQRRGDEIHVSYNLLDERIDRSYSIRLYTSKDNFIRPAEKVDGDVGVDIHVGPNKKIIWSAKDELGDDFSSSLQLELKGQLYVPFIQLDGITEGMVVKRATANDLVWAGGRGDNILQIELYQGDKLVKSFDEFPNTGQATISVPSNVKPGSGYRYRISDSKNRDEVVYSDPFTIKRKIPLIPKLLAMAAIGIGGYILVDNLIPENVPDLPSPPSFPER